MCRFVFVRHPFARVLHAYFKGASSLGLETEAYRSFMTRVRGYPLEEYKHELQHASLLLLLTSLSKQNAGAFHEYFMPHFPLCGIKITNYTLVGRLEELSTHFEVLKRRIFLSTGSFRRATHPQMRYAQRESTFDIRRIAQRL